ncbi:hypothetical protein JKP88DRAFT_264847 [Tribonema minus]|uniref:Uncharacterized protein n=1 Tax=Tribonema minus TaxID=303371 RepID=A0A835YVS8_9STRA|nr:hypothetical protein JKP88DRAFT_264847 [Tribonema minus]
MTLPYTIMPRRRHCPGTSPSAAHTLQRGPHHCCTHLILSLSTSRALPLLPRALAPSRTRAEHKLPYVVSNITFILVSGFGACLLMFTVCADYQRGGLLRGAAALPKHLANAAVLHLVARLLRWHIGRTVYRAFAPADDRPNVFTRFAMAAAAASAGGGSSRPSTAARDDDNNAGGGQKGGRPPPSPAPLALGQEGRAGAKTGFASLPLGGFASPFPGGRHARQKSGGSVASYSESGEDEGGARAASLRSRSRGSSYYVSVGGGGGMIAGSPRRAPSVRSASGGGGGAAAASPQQQQRTPPAARAGRGEVAREPSPRFDSDAATEDATAADGFNGGSVRSSVRGGGDTGSIAGDGGSGGSSGGGGGNGGEAEGAASAAPPGLFSERAAEPSAEGDAAAAAAAAPEEPDSSLSHALRRRRRQKSRAEALRPRHFTAETAHELLDSMFFIKLVDEEGAWMFVEDDLHESREGGGLGWAMSLFHRGYRVGARYAGDVGPHDAHRLVFQCEPGRAAGHVRIRSRGSNTYLFMLGLRRPLTLVAWDREVAGGDWEDMRIVWLPRAEDEGRVLIRCKTAGGYLQWTGTKFVHTPVKDSASRFMLQSLR